MLEAILLAVFFASVCLAVFTGERLFTVVYGATAGILALVYILSLL